MDIKEIIESVGYLGIFACVFIESGVLFGLVLPLPGFSLLFTAGVFAASGSLNLSTIIAVGLAGAIFGYMFGYATGYRYGHKLFSAKNKRYLTPEHAKKTQVFMKKYGDLTLIISRFLPVMHTAAPILSGFAKTPWPRFMIMNVVGGALWVVTATFIGYYLGQTVPNAQYYIIPVVVLVAVLVNTKTVRVRLQKIMDRFDAE